MKLSQKILNKNKSDEHKPIFMLIIKRRDTKKAIGQDNIPTEAIKENISVIAPIGQLNWGFRMVVIVQ